MKTTKLKEIAKNVRIDIIEALAAAKSGHPGGSLSVTDILTILYFDKMNIDPKNPKMEDRDRLVLSKGHVAPALYSVLAERGYFPKENLVKNTKIQEYITVRLSEWCICFFWLLERNLHFLID